MNLRKFVLGSGALFVARASVAVILLALNVLLARHMPIAQVGIYLFLFNLGAVVGTLVNLGVGTAAIRFIAEARERGQHGLARAITIKALLTSVCLFGVATGLAMLAASLGGAELVGGRLHGHVYLAIAWSAAIGIRLAIFDLLVAYEREFEAAVSSGLLAAVLTLAPLLVFAGLGMPITLELALQVSLAAAVLSAMQSVWRLFARLPRGADDELVATFSPMQFFTVGVPAAFSRLLSGRRKELLLVVLGLVLSAADLAILGMANQAVAVIAMPIVAINNAILPHIARANVSSSFTENLRRIRSAWALGIAPIVFIGVATVLLAQPLVRFAFNPQYEAVTPVLTILVIGRIASVLAGPTSQVLMMTGRQWLASALSLIEVVPLVALGLVLGRLYGAIGGAAAFTLTVLFSSVVLTVAIRRSAGVYVYPWIFPGALSIGRSRKPRSALAGD
jgi:O-antigen/teichoic acid export membrane protein